MVAKKSPQANLENKKLVPILMGFVMVLSLLFIFFEWSKKDSFSPPTSQIDQIPYEAPSVVVPNTRTPPPPPPPKVDPVIIEVVPNSTPYEIRVVTVEKPTGQTPGNNNIENPTTGKQELGPVDTTDVQIFVQIMPKFKGDLSAYLSKSLKYPIVAIQNNIQGRVTCQFIVNRDGSIVDVQVVRSVDPSLDKEAVRVIKSMPKWQPGFQNGRRVRVRYTLPINFTLM